MEGAATMAANPKTVEDVFKDYSGRRKGMLKALTAGQSSDIRRSWTL